MSKTKTKTKAPKKTKTKAPKKAKAKAPKKAKAKAPKKAKAKAPKKAKAKTEIKTKAPKAFTEIKCPHCGNTDVDKMEYVEDVLSTRTLSFKEGTLYFSEESNEHVEFAENARLCCKACDKDFPIPEGLPVDMESGY